MAAARTIAGIATINADFLIPFLRFSGGSRNRGHPLIPDSGPRRPKGGFGSPESTTEVSAPIRISVLAWRRPLAQNAALPRPYRTAGVGAPPRYSSGMQTMQHTPLTLSRNMTSATRFSSRVSSTITRSNACTSRLQNLQISGRVFTVRHSIHQGS